jgi:DNA-binding protein H-NS
MNFNELTKHIKQLNEHEQTLHNQRRESAIQRIRELRQRTRSQQETLACDHTTREVQ